MHAALRPYVTAGVALACASLIAVTPLGPSQPAQPAIPRPHVATIDVSLAAAVWANAPANLVNAILNIPISEVNAINEFADSLQAPVPLTGDMDPRVGDITGLVRGTGNWWVYGPTNVLGWDPANPANTWAVADMLVPFPALSYVWGQDLNWWIAANFPMDANCTGLPPCGPNATGAIAILSKMFRVNTLEFIFGDGYTFGEDGITNPNLPVSDEEGEWGYELGQTGEPVPWYGKTVKFDPNATWNALEAYLTQDPANTTPVLPTAKQIGDTFNHLMRSLYDAFWPFVPQSYIWNPRYSASAYLLRPFAKFLCPTCNKYDPFMPVDWKPGDPIPQPVDDAWQAGSPDSSTTLPTGFPIPSATSDSSLVAAKTDTKSKRRTTTLSSPPSTPAPDADQGQEAKDKTRDLTLPVLPGVTGEVGTGPSSTPTKTPKPKPVRDFLNKVTNDLNKVIHPKTKPASKPGASSSAFTTGTGTTDAGTGDAGK